MPGSDLFQIDKSETFSREFPIWQEQFGKIFDLLNITFPKFPKLNKHLEGGQDEERTYTDCR
ncbi:Uncharacterized protein dnm_080130 [Desulfonema magnum]|uniref:Uncharacterized protein n=1 Tax=Desulfonema magnum TaxID=45655 RepID=A0A975BU93_9BACT|nr:Uncharacterized protein dnm_080130 [Desulfonema magnum]